MADSYIDRSEDFIVSPGRSHLNSDQSSPNSKSSEVEASTSPGDQPASPTKVSSTSWQVKKTTSITSSTHISEVTHHPRSVSTAEFEITNTNHSVDSKENTDCYVDRVETVLEENGVNVTRTSESSFVNISISEIKDSALDVEGTLLSDENKVYSKASPPGEVVFSPSQSFGLKDDLQITSSSEDVFRKNDSDETSVQRITYTPGLSIRDFTLQEIKDKRQKSPDLEQTPSSQTETTSAFDIGRSLSSLQASSMSWTSNQASDDILVSEQDLVQPPMVGELLHISTCKMVNSDHTYSVKDSPEGGAQAPGSSASEDDKQYEMIDQLSVDDVLEMLDEAADGKEISDVKEEQLVKSDDTVGSVQDTKGISYVQETIESKDSSDSFVTSVATDMKVKESSQMEIKTEQVRLGQSSQILESSVSTKKEILVDKSEPIEIERKFNITVETEQKLIDIGATLTSTKSFTDVYYDNLDYTLTLANCWLRKRQDEWQLKDRIRKNETDCPDHTTQYIEITKQSDIVNTLLQRLNLQTSGASSVEEVIKAGALTDFAKFTTTRKTYKLPECSIDLDITDSGFMVGEIEVMTSTDKILLALRTIEETAQKLDLPTGIVPGKMNNYLKYRNIRMYNTLVLNSIIPSDNKYSSSNAR